MQTTQQRPTGRLAAVLDLIPLGIEHPITIATIAERTGLSARDVYAIIRVLLMQYDVPVGGIRSNGLHGVFIATNEQERAAALAPLANNAKEIMRRVHKLRQIKLDGEAYPETQDPASWELKDNDSIVYITVDMAEWYRQKAKWQNTKTVRRTITVPEYLNDFAKERHVNVSRLATQELEREYQEAEGHAI